MGQQKADTMGDDPFYKNALEGYQPQINETPRTMASNNERTKLVVAKNPKSGL